MNLKRPCQGDTPIIDISPFLSGDSTDKQRVAETISQACEATGFLIIDGHDVSRAILENAFRFSR